MWFHLAGKNMEQQYTNNQCIQISQPKKIVASGYNSVVFTTKVFRIAGILRIIVA